MVMFATIIGHEVTGLEVTSAKYIMTVLHDEEGLNSFTELNNGDTLNKARQHNTGPHSSAPQGEGCCPSSPHPAL